MPPTTLHSPTMFSNSLHNSEMSFNISQSDTETQTDELPSMLETSSSQNFSRDFSSLPDTSLPDLDDVEVDSVMDRLTRSVGRLFLMQQDRQDRGTQTVKDPLTTETEKLAFDLVYFAVGKRKRNSGEDVIRCLRNSVTKMLERHSIVFTSMMSRLQIDRNVDLKLGFNQLADELFVNSQISWGKIVALFAFGARIAQHVQDQGDEDLVFDIATLLAQFAVDKLTPFLKANGGWATICEVFPVENDYESTIWKSLIFTGMGLTAIATILAFHR